MPFNPSNKSAGDLIRSQDWNAAMAAIAALFDKLNPDATIGHSHTGGPEDGPKIDTAGINDLAVTLQKIADAAISTAKLQDGAVTKDKIGPLAVDGTKIATNSISGSHIQVNSINSNHIVNGSITINDMGANSVGATQIIDLSVGTNELANGAVTALKMAPGVLPGEIGVSIGAYQSGQTASIPSGFLLSECKFLCAIKTWQFTQTGSGATRAFNATINQNTGLVSISTDGNLVYAHVMAIGKKGGW
ncbi:MAG: hypothetical protein H6581_14100 [Bacteroidia bacterium]|nr:hypothetical protein [Bacteroidia bacterium]